jgi:hypothetical protein
MHAVFDDETNSITFVRSIPRWFQGRFERNVTLDPLPKDLQLWPPGAARPERVLCVARDDPKHYRLFKYGKDVDPNTFIPTGKTFIGVLPRPRAPSPEEIERMDAMEANAGRWVAWTRGLGRIVGAGETRDEAIAEAARAGHTDVATEWIPPSLDVRGAWRS